MAVQRWTFTDPVTNESLTFERNPDSLTSPDPRKQLTFARGTSSQQSRPRTFRTPSSPVDWQFGGPIHSQAHHEALKAWAQRAGKVIVTDHLGRSFECFLQSYQLTERIRTKRNPWRSRYLMKALVLRRTA